MGELIGGSGWVGRWLGGFTCVDVEPSFLDALDEVGGHVLGVEDVPRSDDLGGLGGFGLFWGGRGGWVGGLWGGG